MNHNMKIINRLLIFISLLFLFNNSKAQDVKYEMYYDTLSVNLSDAIECIIFPKYVSEGRPEITDEWIESVYESEEMHQYIKSILSDELQSVVEYLRVTESRVIYIEMKSLGIDIGTNEYSFTVCIKYIPDKKSTYEEKGIEVYK